MTTSELISYALVAIGGSAVIIGTFLYISLFFGKIMRGKTAQAPDTGQADLMILVQTMRDMLNQQKELARQLNTSLDAKVTFIKETVDSAMGDLDNLRAGLRAVVSHMERLKEDVAKTRKQVYGSGNAAGPIATPNPSVPAPDLKQKTRLETLARPERPERSREEKDALHDWVGMDFGGIEELDTNVPEVQESSQARQPVQTRQAYRELLDMGGDEDGGHRPGAVNDAHSKGNGKSAATGKASPLQMRVYSYYDAGMTVSQIARELGIGKGEVRLILSLRKARG